MASKKSDDKTMNSSPEVDEFMEGPLVTWFQSCLSSPERLCSYEDLIDGILIHEVILLIQPEPEHKGVVVPSYKDPIIRIRNMAVNVRNVRSIYENQLFQTILVCPDPVALAGGEEGNEEVSLAAMQLMLLLLLGAAVQGPSKELFIEDIKQLPLNCQHSIVDCIKQVTNSQQLVLTQDWGETISMQGYEGAMPELLASHVMRLAKERDTYLTKWTASLLGESECHSNEANSTILPGQRTPNGGKEEANARERTRSTGHHSAVAIAVEVSEWKARVRRLRQELEERTETLAESREEAERFHADAIALRRRVQELSEEARAGAAYRDEVDALRERAEQADRLEGEIRRYKERLGDTEFYRSRVEELREDNRVLLETKELLEEQLSVARRRAEKTLQVEGDLERARREIADLALERDSGRDRAVELAEEVARLRLHASSQWRQALSPGHKSRRGENGDGSMEDDDDDDSSGLENRSLSEQLCSEAEARALRLELENSRLVAELEAKKQELGGEMAAQLNTLKGENKRLTMKIEQLQEGNSRWNAEREELETGLQEALMERRRLQNSLDSIKEVNRVHLEEKQILQAKLEERDSSLREARLENLRLTEEVKKYQAEEDRKAEEMQKARDQVTTLQKEVTALLREISKLKEDLEAKEVSIEQLVTQGEAREEEMQRVSHKEEEMQAQIKRLQDVEREMAECQRKAMEDHDTLATLQGDLVREKTERQILHTTLTKVETAFVRLGVELPWKLGELETESSIDPDVVIDRIKSSSEIQKAVKDTLQLGDNKFLQSVLDGKEDKESTEIIEESTETLEFVTIDNHASEKILKLEEEVSYLRAELKLMREKEREATKEEVTAGVTQEVEIATLQSRIQSLTDQHTALHLANSQLVAEKEEMAREMEREQNLRQLLLQSQEKLGSLHSDLTADYECVTQERDTARVEARAAKSEAEKYSKAISQLKEALQEERKALHTTSSSLANLRDEHSRLKDDFRWVYSVTEKQKAEIKALKFKQRSSMNIHHIMSRVGSEGLGPDEINLRRDSITSSIPEEADRARLEAECLMLREMNSHLIEERRSLMSHASRLLNECHGLFSHSLEDKQHFYKEERAFMDHVNDLKRQKEKLEEKIMELYRSAESSSKKKSFGANLVKKVRKAGSDFISKVPRGGRSWNREGRRSLSHLNVQLMSDVASGSGGDEGEEDDVDRIEEGNSGNGEWETSVVSTSADTDALLPPATLRLAGAGSRQGVYYTSPGSTEKSPKGEEIEGQSITDQESCLPVNDETGFRSSPGSSQGDKTNTNVKTPPTAAPSSRSPLPSVPPFSPGQHKDGRSLLVYNRITTNIGTGSVGSGYNQGDPSNLQPPTCPSHHGRNSSVSPRSSPLPQDENESQWFEFGCV